MPLQSRCLFNIREAFQRIQKDIDPLQQISHGKPCPQRRSNIALRQVCDSSTWCVTVGIREEGPVEGLPTAQPAVQKRWTQEERSRAQRFAGIINNVLQVVSIWCGVGLPLRSA